jgi:transposase
MDRAEAEAVYDAGREACVGFLLELTAGYDAQIARLEERIGRLEEQARRDSRTSSKPPSSDPPKTRQQRRAEARAKAKELLGGERKAGGQPGHPGSGRELKPEDQVDENVDHYPDTCGGCGQKFLEDEQRPGSRFGRHQVAELPPISVILVEHRTHRLGCPGCGIKTTAGLPAGIAGSAFGPNLQAALVTLTARNRISRRGMIELASDLFGVSLSIGGVDQICQRASDALARPHAQLHDWVLDQGAVHVDETGWRTAGDGRALWTLTTPGAAIFQIAEHCNREQFQALIGPYPGIIVSDRWNGYEHLDPHQRQVCWSHIQRDFRRHSEGLAGRRRSVSGASSSPAACSARGAPTSTTTTTANSSRPRSRRSRPSYDSCSNKPRRRAGAPAGTGGPRTTCSRCGPRSGPSPSSRASSRPTTPPNARSAGRSSTENSPTAPPAPRANASPNAPSRPPPPAACKTAHCSPTYAN